jgi:hypothetical protein
MYRRRRPRREKRRAEFPGLLRGKGGGKPDEKDRFQHIMPDCVCIETSMMGIRIYIYGGGT